MRQIVIDGFPDFTTEFESNRDYLYADNEGFLTIGPGLLAQPRLLLVAMGIDFRHPDGTQASSADVDAAWEAVRAVREKGKNGSAQFAAVTTLRATRASLDHAARRKLLANEVEIRKFFPTWDSFPAPGQLLIMSMTWAMGGGAWFHWPHFCACVNKADWQAVAVPHGDPNSCQMNEQKTNEWFRRRNAANLELAKRAARALAGGGVDDLDVRQVLDVARAVRASALGLKLEDYVAHFAT